MSETTEQEVPVGEVPVEADRPMTVVELAEEFREDLKHLETRARYFAKI